MWNVTVTNCTKWIKIQFCNITLKKVCISCVLILLEFETLKSDQQEKQSVNPRNKQIKASLFILFQKQNALSDSGWFIVA